MRLVPRGTNLSTRGPKARGWISWRRETWGAVDVGQGSGAVGGEGGTQPVQPPSNLNPCTTRHNLKPRRDASGFKPPTLARPATAASGHAATPSVRASVWVLGYRAGMQGQGKARDGTRDGSGPGLRDDLAQARRLPQRRPTVLHAWGRTHACTTGRPRVLWAPSMWPATAEPGHAAATRGACIGARARTPMGRTHGLAGWGSRGPWGQGPAAATWGAACMGASPECPPPHPHPPKNPHPHWHQQHQHPGDTGFPPVSCFLHASTQHIHTFKF
jgi:hypothetical protein